MAEQNSNTWAQLMLESAQKGAMGIFVLGRVAEVTPVSAGSSDGRTWDAYTKVRIVCGDGVSFYGNIKKQGAAIPAEGHVGVFAVPRPYKGQSGVAGDITSFV